MKRQINIEEISDGKRYRAEDMVKADCGGCKDCSACCHGMGESIVLDPLDVWRLCRAEKTTMQELMRTSAELHVVDGVILPNLRMTGKEDGCYYLNEDGRCRIHGARPGICRMFPLGRIYENGGMSYFLQLHECKKESRSKIKVKKWIDTPNLKQYEQYILSWHYFLEAAEEKTGQENGMNQKEISLHILKNFYFAPYSDTEDFYIQFKERLLQAKKELQI